MSYSPTVFLTLLLMFASAPLVAQQRELSRQVQRLSAPAAWEREDAVQRIAAMPGDIGPDLRVAYRVAHGLERAGMLQAALKRNDPALVAHAAAALSGEDERIAASARAYLLALSAENLDEQQPELDQPQQAAWQDFLSFRLRRDIVTALLEDYLKPGGLADATDDLRKRDSAGLDRELLALLRSDTAFRDPLQLAVEERIARGTEASRMFAPNWRQLNESVAALPTALSFFAEGGMTEDLELELSRAGTARLAAGLVVVIDLRAAATRALADSPHAGTYTDQLQDAYDLASDIEPPRALRNSLDTETLKTEIEVVMARLGKPEMLTARIEGLRAHIQRARMASGNLNAAGGNRPDLLARHRIAQLLLRAGDHQGAEKEWAVAVEDALELLRDNGKRSRSALVSYIGACLYNLACAQGLQLKLSLSLESLKAAVDHGYKDFAWMLEDADLAHVRRMPEFDEWFRRAAPPAVVDTMAID